MMTRGSGRGPTNRVADASSRPFSVPAWCPVDVDARPLGADDDALPLPAAGRDGDARGRRGRRLREDQRAHLLRRPFPGDHSDDDRCVIVGHTRTHTHAHAHTHTHTHMRARAHMPAHTHMCAHTHTRTHTRSHTHTRTHTSACLQAHAHRHTRPSGRRPGRIPPLCGGVAADRIRRRPRD